MSSKIRTKVDHKLIESEHVDAADKKKALQTALFNIADINVFLGSVLQCMDIYYTHLIPRAGIMFEADAKKWQMAINPKWFCHKLTDKERVAVLQHELYHITHKHPMRAPFLKLAPHKRMMMNIAMDMAINQFIINLPKGCPHCPPIEEQFKGAQCQSDMCPGGVIDIAHYFDEEANGVKKPWDRRMPFEFYYNKLIQKFLDNDNGRDPEMIGVEYVCQDPLDATPSGARETKHLIATGPFDLLTLKADLKVGDAIALVIQNDPVDNGVYDIKDLGSATTPFVLVRHSKHNGSMLNRVHVNDAAVDKHQKLKKAQKPKGWVIVGQARAADSDLVNVDQAPLHFEEKDLDGKSGGNSKGESPQEEFDSHQWENNAEESEVMGATEELIKRAMQKASLTYDKLDAHIKELLQDIEARRSELNHKQIILSAIKKNASGFNREHSWTRKSRRFGNKAPGTRNGKLPQLDNYIDTSGSISVEEANDHMAIIDEFLKVGSRKCNVGLWHTDLYYHKPYKLGDRIPREDFESGGTDTEPALRKIFETKPDLAIIYTDGCYSNVDVESWMKPGDTFPQILWIISKDGMENHPLKRLGETIKIPKTDAYGSDRDLENV